MDKTQLNNALESLIAVNLGNSDAANTIKAQIAEIEAAEKAAAEAKAAQEKADREAKAKAEKEKSISAAKAVLADVIGKLATASNNGMDSLIETLKDIAKKADKEPYDYDELWCEIFRHGEETTDYRIVSTCLESTIHHVITWATSRFGEIPFEHIKRFCLRYIIKKDGKNYERSTINVTLYKFFSDPQREFGITYKNGHKTIIRREAPAQQQVA